MLLLYNTSFLSLLVIIITFFVKVFVMTVTKESWLLEFIMKQEGEDTIADSFVLKQTNYRFLSWETGEDRVPGEAKMERNSVSSVTLRDT